MKDKHKAQRAKLNKLRQESENSMYLHGDTLMEQAASLSCHLADTQGDDALGLESYIQAKSKLAELKVTLLCIESDLNMWNLTMQVRL